MTHINRLVCEGFKSFARRTELVFGDKFNVILGPNGSGKSNVIDALCFVLGRMSTKSMRAEKSANLIYNGGKSKKPADQAEVTIYFDNSKKEFPFDTAEVKVTRIVKQDGQGIYKINDKKVTRQQVIELLSLAKINPNGYNIVMQGDIVKFVELASDERRQLIEEIAGIGVYEEKKNKALNELAKVDEKLKEADIILTERHSALKELKKDKEQAIKYNELNKKIVSCKASIAQKKINERQKSIDAFEEKIKSFNARIEKLNNQIKDNEAKIEGLIREKEKINEEIERRGEKEQVSIHKQVEQLKVDIASKHNKIENYRNEIKRLQDRKDQLIKNCGEISEKLKSLESEKSSLRKAIEQNEKELEQVEKRIQDFRKKNEMQNIEKLEKEIEDSEKLLEEKEKEIQDLRLNQQELLRSKDKIEFQLQAIDEKIAKVLELEKEAKAQLDELKQKKQEFKRLTLELNTLVNEDSKLAAQIGNARNDLDRVNAEYIKMTARQATLQEFASADVAMKKLLDDRRKFKIYGTVSELGKVSEKYSLALEIAAGTKIKSIVTEDDKGAADCIKFLKQHKYGIATFLPLNKIKGKPISEEARKYEKVEGVHGFAIDLIKFDQKFKPIFSYVFGDALIVENIDVVRKIGVGNIKMVTLDGDVSELSGAMQGGYRQKERSVGFRQEEIENKVSELEKKKSDLEEVIKKLEAKREENAQTIQRMRELKANLEADIIKLEKTLHLEEGDTDANKSEKSRLKAELKDIDKKIENITEKVSEANKVLADLKIKRQEIKAKVSQLRNPALIAELNAFEQKKQELKENIIKLNAEVSGIEAQIKNILGPEYENIQKIIKSHERDEKSFEEEIRKIEDQIKTDEQNLRKKEAEQQKFMQQFSELFEKQKRIEEEIKQKQDKISELREKVHSEEVEMNNLRVSNAQVLTEYNQLKEELSSYKDYEIINKNIADLEQDLRNAERSLQNLGSINMRALEVYDTMEKEYNTLLEKKERLIAEREDVLMMMNEIETKKKELFMATFETVNQNFMNKFQQLSKKGEAMLVLENKENPFEGGVLVKVRITGNKYLDIRSLSGGEKTLTALAFIFCIQEFEPAPFYVMDEVDAALDKDNSDKLSKLIRSYAERSQYIVISHNDTLITEADTLYGVSMNEDGVSNVVSIKI